jgi:5-methylcytosine-specific restriction enzyme B
MPLERYALGTPDSSESFCGWMEFNTPQIASIRGGSSMKLLIFARLNDPGWYFDPRFANEQEAWQAVRAGFVKAFDLAAEERFAEIGSIDAISSALSLVTKSVYTYFPTA